MDWINTPSYITLIVKTPHREGKPPTSPPRKKTEQVSRSSHPTPSRDVSAHGGVSPPIYRVFFINDNFYIIIIEVEIRYLY